MADTEILTAADVSQTSDQREVVGRRAPRSMMVHMLKGKVHRATVTDANLEYEGSLTIDPDLREAAGMLTHEKVHVLNINSGDRFETYLIDGERGRGEMCLNGAAARLGQKGDKIIVLTYAMMEEEDARSWRPRVVLVDSQNKILKVNA